LRHRVLGPYSLGALALVPLGQVHLGFGIAGTAIATVTWIIATRIGDGATVRIATMTLLIAVIGASGAPFGIWFVIGLMWLTSRWWSVLTPDQGWVPAGHATPLVRWLTVLTVIGAGIALTFWALRTDQFAEATVDLADMTSRLPLGVVAISIVVFVIANSITEEVAYRGIAFEAAAAVFPTFYAVVAQAIAFGTLHVAGFPSGVIGVGLALGYGLVLGTIRQITGGLRFPIIAHMAADATIAVLVVVLI